MNASKLQLVKILRLIRDSAPTVREVAAAFDLSVARRRPHYSDHPATRVSVWDLLESLGNLGLVAWDDSADNLELERPKPTPRLSELQSTLGLSLRWLEEEHSGSVLRVSPFHGIPDSNADGANVFLLSPFTDEMTALYEHTIKPAVEDDCGLTCARADDFFTTHAVMRDVWEGIYASRFVVADCTGKNPNVFYEIGLAHAIGKPTILLTRDIQDMPFDLKHIRTIVYDYSPNGVANLRYALARTLEALCQPPRRRDRSTASGRRFADSTDIAKRRKS
jgi:hypothetical protein